MSDTTAIQWTDHTFNCWWGCARVSPACRSCYADSIAHRWGQDLWHRKGPRRFMSNAYWRKPLAWNRAAEQKGTPARVFCASMADVFEDHPIPEIHAQQDAARARLWELIDATPWLRWQLLTKRPENVIDMVPWTFAWGWGWNWPTNVWLGTSVENQRWADERVPTLLRIPAAVHFLSCEPLLDRVRLDAWLDPALLCLSGCNDKPTGQQPMCSVACRQLGGTMGTISWVICGGESGTHARPLNLDWARDLRDQCTAHHVPFLFKQVGGRTHDAGGRLLDGREWTQFPVEVTT